jgi:hypothetical protein
VESYLRWLDETVFAEAARASSRVVLVADPGRSATASAEGFVAVAGGGAQPRCVGPPVANIDVAPIALEALGLPESREMDGRVPAACPLGPARPTPIATWGRRGASVSGTVSAYDPEMVERLKSLGYLR